MYFYLFDVSVCFVSIPCNIFVIFAFFLCIRTSTTIAVGVPVVHLVDLICRIYNVFEGSLVSNNSKIKINKYSPLQLDA